MKITAPVKSSKYVEAIISSGAEELFGGIVDEKWMSRYGNYIEFNRRGSYGSKANISSYEEMTEIIRIASYYGVEFDLTINALQLWEEQIPFLESILDKYLSAGGKNVIISDISLIPLMKERNLKIIMSSCANVNNSLLASAFFEMGCSKIIFPRDICISEMKNIISRTPELKFEMFMMNSGCRFQDGNCLGLHNTCYKELCSYCGKEGWTFLKKNNKTISVDEYSRLEDNSEEYRKLLKHACGQCMIYPMLKSVDSVKVLERSGSEETLLQLIKITAENIRIAENSEGYYDFLSNKKTPKDANCCGFRSCYYRSDMFSLEYRFHLFLAETNFIAHKDKIDFIGINVSCDSSNPFSFKNYYNSGMVKTPYEFFDNPILSGLAKKHMIGGITYIERKDFCFSKSYDLRLSNRENGNIQYFFKTIESSYSNISKDRMLLVRQLAKLKICDSDNYQYAALYYYGFRTDNNRVTHKFHFLTRHCENADKIYENYYYDDALYIEALKESSSKELIRIALLISPLLEKNTAHLWMVGVDLEASTASSEQDKYKIYVKDLNDSFFSEFSDQLLLQNFPVAFIKSAKELEKLKKQKDFHIYGMGICWNAQKGYSLNIYLKYHSMT